MKIEKEPISGQYGKFKIDGIDYRIYWEEAGQGIPLVCLHTAGSDGRQYRALLNDKKIFCDPQTSGGLLITVQPKQQAIVEKILKTHDCLFHPIGSVVPNKADQPQIHISG
mgnify:CR=1 FL=1